MAGAAVEDPDPALTPGPHALDDRGARLPGSDQAYGNEGGELGERGEIGRRVGHAAQLLQHDGEFHHLRRIHEFGPAEVRVRAPQRLRVTVRVDDSAHQRRRALLGEDLADGLLPQPLVIVELEEHRRLLVRMSVNDRAQRAAPTGGDNNVLSLGK